MGEDVRLPSEVVAPGAPVDGAPRRRLAGRLGIGLLDSGVSSAGNLGVSIIAARATSLPSFGVFATAMLVLILCQVASRSVHGDALVLKTRGDAHSAGADVRRSTTSALRLAVLAGAVGAGLALVAGPLGLAWSRDVVLTVLVSSAVLPLLCLQDQLRWVDYARGESQHALVNNALWTASALGGLLVADLAHDGELPPWLCIALWGFGVLPGIGWALSRNRAFPARTGRSHWLGGNAGLVRPLFLDFALTQATAQGAVLVVAALSSSSELALIRKGQIWLGLATVVTTGLLSALQPVLAQRTAALGPASTVRLATLVGSVVSAVFLAYGAVLLLLPTDVAELVVGPGWEGVRPFLAPLAVAAAGGMMGGCLGLALRTTGRIRRQVAWRAVLAPVFIVATTVAAWVAGARTGMWVIAATSVVTALVWAVLLVVSREDAPGVAT